MLNRRLFVQGAAAASLSAPLSLSATAATPWPTKTVRIVVGFSAGGQTDAFARMYGDFLGKAIGQTVVIENKTGALGSIAGAEVKRAAPDGHTILFNTSGAMTVNRVLIKDLAYDTDRDFDLVSAMPTGGLPLVISKKLGVNSLEDYIKHARSTGRATLGTFGIGSPAHLTVIELNKQFGVNIEPIHYRGEAPMWTDVLANTIDGGVGSITGAQPVLQSNAGVAIAVPRRRLASLPDVKTFSEQGATSRLFDLTTYQCCAVPKGTPKEVIERLSDILVQGGKSEKAAAMHQTYGIDESAMTLEATRALYASEAPVWIDLASKIA